MPLHYENVLCASASAASFPSVFVSALSSIHSVHGRFGYYMFVLNMECRVASIAHYKIKIKWELYNILIHAFQNSMNIFVSEICNPYISRESISGDELKSPTHTDTLRLNHWYIFAMVFGIFSLKLVHKHEFEVYFWTHTVNLWWTLSEALTVHFSRLLFCQIQFVLSRCRNGCGCLVVIFIHRRCFGKITVPCSGLLQRLKPI